MEQGLRLRVIPGGSCHAAWGRLHLFTMFWSGECTSGQKMQRSILIPFGTNCLFVSPPHCSALGVQQLRRGELSVGEGFPCPAGPSEHPPAAPRPAQEFRNVLKKKQKTKSKFSEKSGAAPAEAARCQEASRVVEAPAGTAALPAANPLREHGNKTVPLARLLLEHTLININPVSLHNSQYIFHSLCAKRAALPRIMHQNREHRSTTLGQHRQVRSEVNRSLAPLQLTALFAAPSKALVILGNGLARLWPCGDPCCSSAYVRREPSARAPA